MATPAPTAEIPCCSPATAEQVGAARADILVGQGNILKTAGDYTTSILQDANLNQNHLLNRMGSDTQFLAGVSERGFTATQSQVDKFGLANLNATREVGDKVSGDVDRQGFANLQATHGESDKLNNQANTIAWNQAGILNANFAEARAQNERINDAQSAYSDRAFKYTQQQNSDSFARLSGQSENGFYRTLGAVEGVGKQVVQSEIGLGKAVYGVDKQVVQSEIGIGKAVTAGFSETNGRISDSYARLSEQNCDLKSAIAAAQAAAAECCCEVKQEVLRTGKELGLQAAQNFGAIQVEASKNTAALQLQAAVNLKDSFLEQSKWFALAEKTAMVNKCELEAKMAACCCEIKEAVGSSAAATQSLIQAQEANRVRDALAAASTENAILKLRREEHHHHPHFPYPYPYPFPPGPPGVAGGR